MADRKGLLLVISGPSGCGKGTVCKSLLGKHKDIVVSISATTRDIRAGEVEGKDYFFTTKERFEQQINDGEFLEYARIYSGHYYGTPKRFVNNMLDEGKDVILEIDIQGALQVKEKFDQAVLIFLMPPSLQELRSRLINRGRESIDLINERFNAAKDEIKLADGYDYVVINDTVDGAVVDVEAIITAEKCKMSRNQHIINTIQNGGF